MKRYEIIDHTADIAIKAYGSSLEELFTNAAYGMCDIIADLDGLKPTTSIKVDLTADNAEELLIAWLDEILYRFYTKKIIFCDFNITELTEKKISAEVLGRPIGNKKSRLNTEIKAATYHDLKIEKENGSYKVQIVFDV